MLTCQDFKLVFVLYPSDIIVFLLDSTIPVE